MNKITLAAVLITALGLSACQQPELKTIEKKPHFIDSQERPAAQELCEARCILANVYQVPSETVPAVTTSCSRLCDVDPYDFYKKFDSMFYRGFGETNN